MLWAPRRAERQSSRCIVIEEGDNTEGAGGMGLVSGRMVYAVRDSRGSVKRGEVSVEERLQVCRIPE